MVRSRTRPSPRRRACHRATSRPAHSRRPPTPTEIENTASGRSCASSAASMNPRVCEVAGSKETMMSAATISAPLWSGGNNATPSTTAASQLHVPDTAMPSGAGHRRQRRSDPAAAMDCHFRTTDRLQPASARAAPHSAVGGAIVSRYSIWGNAARYAAPSIRKTTLRAAPCNALP